MPSSSSIPPSSTPLPLEDLLRIPEEQAKVLGSMGKAARSGQSAGAHRRSGVPSPTHRPMYHGRDSDPCPSPNPLPGRISMIAVPENGGGAPAAGIPMTAGMLQRLGTHCTLRPPFVVSIRIPGQLSPATFMITPNAPSSLGNDVVEDLFRAFLQKTANTHPDSLPGVSESGKIVFYDDCGSITKESSQGSSTKIINDPAIVDVCKNFVNGRQEPLRESIKILTSKSALESSPPLYNLQPPVLFEQKDNNCYLQAAAHALLADPIQLKALSGAASTGSEPPNKKQALKLIQGLVHTCQNTPRGKVVSADDLDKYRQALKLLLGNENLYDKGKEEDADDAAIRIKNLILGDTSTSSKDLRLSLANEGAEEIQLNKLVEKTGQENDWQNTEGLNFIIARHKQDLGTTAKNTTRVLLPLRFGKEQTHELSTVFFHHSTTDSTNRGHYTTLIRKPNGNGGSTSYLRNGTQTEAVFNDAQCKDYLIAHASEISYAQYFRNDVLQKAVSRLAVPRSSQPSATNTPTMNSPASPSRDMNSSSTPPAPANPATGGERTLKNETGDPKATVKVHADPTKPLPVTTYFIKFAKEFKNTEGKTEGLAAKTFFGRNAETKILGPNDHNIYVNPGKNLTDLQNAVEQALERGRKGHVSPIACPLVHMPGFTDQEVNDTIARALSEFAKKTKIECILILTEEQDKKLGLVTPTNPSARPSSPTLAAKAIATPEPPPTTPECLKTYFKNKLIIPTFLTRTGSTGFPKVDKFLDIGSQLAASATPARLTNTPIKFSMHRYDKEPEREGYHPVKWTDYKSPITETDIGISANKFHMDLAKVAKKDKKGEKTDPSGQKEKIVFFITPRNEASAINSDKEEEYFERYIKLLTTQNHFQYTDGEFKEIEVIFIAPPPKTSPA